MGASGLVLASCGSSEPDTPSTATEPPTTTDAVPADAPNTTAATSTTGLPADAGTIFSLGVASGDPLLDSIVLWTRLAPDPRDPLGGLGDSGPIDVAWQVASDPEFTTIISEGSESALPDHVHSLRVVVDGLSPGTDYWYRFEALEATSPTGHLRTLPAQTDSYRIAAACCQSYMSGYYNAHRDLAATDVDLVLWLGDFIYEWSPNRPSVRAHNGPDCHTLDEYRERFAQYRTDPDLQAASAAHAWMVLIDDHEMFNDVAGTTLEGESRERALAGLIAWWEHQPTRLPMPTIDRLIDPMYQSVDIGDLARITTLDTRTNRTALPCGDDIVEQCDAALTTGTLLGDEQRAWVEETLAGPPVTWDIIAQQLMVGGFDISESEAGILVSTDTWDGYQKDREWLASQLDTVANPIILSGDFHLAMVNEVRSDPRNRELPVSAIEFMATSLTTEFFRFLTFDSVERFENALPDNPQVQWSANERGYLITTLGRDTLTTEYRAVSDVADVDAPVSTSATFTVDAGTRAVTRT